MCEQVVHYVKRLVIVENAVAPKVGSQASEQFTAYSCQNIFLRLNFRQQKTSSGKAQVEENDAITDHETVQTG
jgi:hypothetical protein